MYKIKFIILTLLIIFISSCENSLVLDREIDSDYLVESPVFIEFANSLEKFMFPVVSHTNNMNKKDFTELESKLSIEFKSMIEMDEDAPGFDQKLSNLVILLGHENLENYKELFENLQSSLVILFDTYPELDGFEESVPLYEIEKAINQLFSYESGPINYLVNGEIKLSPLIEKTGGTCGDVDGLVGCLESATSHFNWRTAQCIITGVVGSFVGTPVGGVAAGASCQAFNVIFHELAIQDCIENNC